MRPHVSMITLGVRDLNGARRFYGEGLGWPVLQEQPGAWVAFRLGDGTSALGLFSWDALAADAGVPGQGVGFRGVTLSYVVRNEERVRAVLEEARRAGGTIVRPAERAPWGGTSGVFADPDGHLWKVAFGSGAEPFAAEERAGPARP